jgi:hypothetical protein
MFYALNLTKRFSRSLVSSCPGRGYHCTSASYGIKEFFDPVLPAGEVFVVGREWSVADLRRKVEFLLFRSNSPLTTLSRVTVTYTNFGMSYTKKEIFF